MEQPLSLICFRMVTLLFARAFDPQCTLTTCVCRQRYSREFYWRKTVEATRPYDSHYQNKSYIVHIVPAAGKCQARYLCLCLPPPPPHFFYFSVLVGQLYINLLNI